MASIGATVAQVRQSGIAVLRALWYFRGATLGSRVRVWGRLLVTNNGTMVIGDRSRFIATIASTELATGEDGRLEIGDSVFINSGCSISAQQLVRIGDGSNIGTHCMIMDSDFHRQEPERRTEMPEPEPVVLEENVWLGGRVIVLKGVTIGAHSVIGAGSVVTTDIPPRSVAAGMPAKVVRTL